MNPSMLKIFKLSLCCMLVFGGVSTASAAEMDLAGLLTKSLSVTPKQAEGGAGALFKSASQEMGAEDFAKVTKALPEVQSLMKAAPTLDSASGSLGSLSSAFGKSGGSMASMAGVAGAFSQLGLGGDMVQQFVPIILNYAQDKGGDVVAGLLKTAFQ